MKKFALVLAIVGVILIIFGLLIKIHDLNKDYMILQNENDSLKITILHQGDEINRINEENIYLWEHNYCNGKNWCYLWKGNIFRFFIIK